MSAANTPQTPGSYPTAWTAGDAPSGERLDYHGSYSRTSYRPTAEQLARDETRQRYLRRNVYAPLIIAALIGLVLFGLIVYLAFWARTPQAASFIAGLSALTVILISIPLTALMAVLPIAWLAFAYSRRQQRRNAPETGPMAYRSRVQILLWQLDGLLNQAQRGAARGGASLRRPLIAIHAWAAYLSEMARGIISRFTRSI
jgi:hypothetical protein